jgi:cytochrome c oxidase subunit 2
LIDILHKLGLPINMSVQGAAIDEINAIVHWLMLVLFVGWGIFFIVSLVKFRASKNAKADYTGVKSHLSSLLEAVVAVIEIVILFGFGFPIWAARVTDVPSTYESVHLRVVAQQFAWNFHYPGPDGKFGKTRADLVDEQENPVGIDRSSDNASDDFYTVNQLHVPVNKKIRIDLTSLDVIHSFTLPELRVKQDVIPGMVIPVHFTATMTSDEFLKTTIGTKREGKSLEVTCAQLCGLGHYRMRGFFTVHDDEGYQAWLDEQAEYLEEESGDDDDWDDDW